MGLPTENSKVYFIMPEAGGAVKIGVSTCPIGRLKVFQAANPSKLDLVAVVPGTPTDERRLHLLFKDSRIHFEWFKDSPELRAFIDTIKVTGALPVFPQSIIDASRPIPHKNHKMPLQEWRVFTGLSVQEAAKHCGIGASTFSETERGKTFPSPKIIRQIERATEGAITANHHFHAWKWAHLSEAKAAERVGRAASRAFQRRLKRRK